MRATIDCSACGRTTSDGRAGMCKPCWTRARRIEKGLPVRPTPMEALTSGYAVSESGCWLWQRSCWANGYGRIRVAGRHYQAHRFAYELLVGPIPDGLVIDHLCRTRNCVNPDHLEPVTVRENNLRGQHPAVIAHITGVCVSGLHEFTPENTIYRANGGRQCRACENASQRKCYRARKEAS